MGAANDAGLLVSNFRKSSGSRSACNACRHALSRRQRSCSRCQIESCQRIQGTGQTITRPQSKVTVARKDGPCSNHRGMERGRVRFALRCEWSDDCVRRRPQRLLWFRCPCVRSGYPVLVSNLGWVCSRTTARVWSWRGLPECGVSGWLALTAAYVWLRSI